MVGVLSYYVLRVRGLEVNILKVRVLGVNVLRIKVYVLRVRSLRCVFQKIVLWAFAFKGYRLSNFKVFRFRVRVRVKVLKAGVLSVKLQKVKVLRSSIFLLKISK